VNYLVSFQSAQLAFYGQFSIGVNSSEGQALADATKGQVIQVRNKLVVEIQP
jgi:flagella basal body P-ring formation protein FlgA